MTEQKWTLVVSTTFVVLLLQVVWSVTNDLYLKNVSQRACKSKGYTSQSLKEGNYSYVESTNGPWMNPGQAINYVTWHRISAVTQYYPCWALLYTANNIFPHSTSPFLNVIGKKWLLPVWSFQTKVRQITHNRVIMLYFILRRLSMITDLKRVDRLGKYFTQCEEKSITISKEYQN